VNARALLSAALYCTALVALTVVSAHALNGAGTCQDVSTFGHVQARTSLGIALPVPVIQMCSGHTLPMLLIVLTILASLAWLGIRRWPPPAWVFVACMSAGLIAALAFPYFATTDPYAYAVYGYRTIHGENPYTMPQSYAVHDSNALRGLYAFFPSGSSDRVANYGPLAILQYQAAAFTAKDSLRGFMIVARALNALLLLLLAWLLMLIRPPQAGRLSSAFIAFHPLVLLESIAFVHGDLLMMVLLCAAWLAYRRNWIAPCAALIVLATEVRVVAGLALVVLLLQAAARRDKRTVLRALGASALTGAVSVGASMFAYGTFTLGGSPALALFSSPFAVLFEAFGVTLSHVVMGGEMQAVAGISIIVLLLCAKRYLYVPLATYAALPIVRAWYCQWLVPLIAIDPDSRPAIAAGVLAGIAIVAEWPEMTAASDLGTWAVILALQWLLPIATLWATHTDRRALQAQDRSTSAPSQSTTPVRNSNARRACTRPTNAAQARSVR
jgi:hypothetical protein